MTAGEFPFVDAHVHLWDLAHIRYPWLTPPFDGNGPNGSVEAIARTYLLDDYLDDAGDWAPAGMVHIDAGAHPGDALKETRWLQHMADRRGLPSAIVGYAPLQDPDVERLLAAHTACPAVRGIRQIVNWHRDPARTYLSSDITADPAWQAGFALLGKYGLSFDLQAYPGQFAGLARLIARHPGVPVIVNHAGMAVDRDAEGLESWRSGMRALAALPNVFVKISGVGFVFRPWTAGMVRDYVRETIDIFGADRALFASDFPTDKLFGDFGRTLGAYDAATADFTEGERRALFGRNADRVYRLGLGV